MGLEVWTAFAAIAAGGLLKKITGRLLLQPRRSITAKFPLMTFSQSLLKLRDQPGAGLWRKPVQIELLPLYCRQVRRIRNPQHRPVRALHA